jgi:hypothetical protein
MLKIAHIRLFAVNDEVILFKYTKYFTVASKYSMLKRKFCIPGPKKCCMLSV